MYSAGPSVAQSARKAFWKSANSARSPAYTTLDAQLGYQQSKQWLVALDVFNMADVRWNDIAYYYASRLKNETKPQADYVVHPGVPRTFRGRFTYYF